ncbi:hypothetical protein PG990_012669 [Apiospora arundinis]
MGSSPLAAVTKSLIMAPYDVIPTKKEDKHLPIPMGWTASPSDTPSDTHQAISRVDVSPSRVSNSALIDRSTSSQAIDTQETPHKNKKKKERKGKTRKGQQELPEQSNTYTSPAAALQSDDAAISEQLPSQS